MTGAVGGEAQGFAGAANVGGAPGVTDAANAGGARSVPRIVIIGSKNGVHCQELTAAFEKRGAQVRFVNALNLAEAAGFGRGAALGGADAAVIRGIPAGTLEQVIFWMDALAVEESRGLPFVNPPKAIEKTVDKYLTTALLERAGLPVPPTMCVPADAPAMRKAFDELGRDVVYKPLFGSCGSGLMRLWSEEEVTVLANRLAVEGRVAYLQMFIPTSGCDLSACGSDIRAFVLGGRVLASMKRKGRDWRANLTLGGEAEPVMLTADEEDLAIRAAAAVGAEVAGVDILRGEDGRRYVIEVNGCPGWQGLAAVTGVDVAGALAEYVLDKIE